MKRKRTSVLILGLGVCILLAACRSDHGSTGVGQFLAGETEERQESEPVVLRTVSMFAGTDANAENYQAINREFLEKYKYVTIEDDSTPSSEEWKKRIAADFAVGNEPDVLQFFTDANAADVLAADKFVTVEEIREAYPEYAANTYKRALDDAAAADGNHYAVPTTGYWEGLFCNKDLFDQYHVKLPEDWDEFLDAIRIFRRNGVTPIAVSLNEVPHYWIDYFTLSLSGLECYMEIPEEGDVPDSFVKALELFHTLREMGAFPEDTDTISNEEAGQLFREKRAAMLLDGSWVLASIPDQENTLVMTLPRVEGGKASRHAMVGGMSSGFYITKKAWDDPEKREAAVRFVMAHTGEDAVQRYWNGTGQAACEVEMPESMTPLARSAANNYMKVGTIAPPLDSRMGGAPYTTLIQCIPKVSTGKMDAREAWEKALHVYKRQRSDKKRDLHKGDAR